MGGGRVRQVPICHDAFVGSASADGIFNQRRPPPNRGLRPLKRHRFQRLCATQIQQKQALMPGISPRSLHPPPKTQFSVNRPIWPKLKICRENCMFPASSKTLKAVPLKRPLRNPQFAACMAFEVIAPDPCPVRRAQRRAGVRPPGINTCTALPQRQSAGIVAPGIYCP
jgi:hypothetical protein